VLAVNERALESSISLPLIQAYCVLSKQTQFASSWV